MLRSKKQKLFIILASLLPLSAIIFRFCQSNILPLFFKLEFSLIWDLFKVDLLYSRLYHVLTELDKIYIILIIALLILLSLYIKTIVFQIKRNFLTFPIIYCLTLTVFILFSRVFYIYLITALFVLLLLLLLNYLTWLHTRKVSKITLEKDQFPLRTEGYVTKILKTLKQKNIHIVNLDGSWGNGKTYILKHLYNIARRSASHYLPIFLPLDQLDSADQMIKKFSRNLNTEIYNISGIRNDFDISSFIKAFTSVDEKVGLFSPFLNAFGNDTNAIDYFNKIKGLKDKKILVIIDDLDRVLSMEEIKFVFEFITYLREHSTKFKIVYASNNEQLYPLIGYQLLKLSGQVEDELVDTLSKSISKTKQNNPNMGIFIHESEYSPTLYENSSIEGKIFMDKYRDALISLPLLSNNNLSNIFFREISDLNMFSQNIVNEASKKITRKYSIPFDGNIRKMKKLLGQIYGLDRDLINKNSVSLTDVLIICWHAIEEHDFIENLLNGEVYYNKTNIQIGSSQDITLNALWLASDHKFPFKDKKNLKRYQKLFDLSGNSKGKILKF